MIKTTETFGTMMQAQAGRLLKEDTSFVTVLLCFNGMLISGIYVLAKIAREEGIVPVGLLAWQLFFAAAVIGVIAVLRDELPALTVTNLRYAAGAGVLGITGPYLITYAALAHIPAGLVGVITALAPGLTYVIAVALRAEKVQSRRLVGVLFGFAGVMAILAPSGSLPSPEVMPWALVAIIAPILQASGNVFRTLAWPPGLKPLAAASLLLSIQSLALVPLSLALDIFEVPQTLTHARDFALLGAGGLTAMFYLGAFELQKRGGAVVAGQIGYVITVATLVMGALIFGERYPLTTILAAMLVLVGVMLVNSRPNANTSKLLKRFNGVS